MDFSKRILLIDFCNYDDYPIGGYLTRAKNLMSSFGNVMVLVGISTDKNEPIGRWFKKTINGTQYDYFALAYYSKTKTKHFIPDRLVTYLLIKYFKKDILDKNLKNAFIQRQEVLQSVRAFGFENICYCFAGLENPLAISKYRYAHHLAEYFERGFFRNLKSVQLILAAGDESAIQNMVARSNGIISRESVHQFASRINTDVYKPLAKKEIRRTLHIREDARVIVTTGRLAWLKGWKFMIDSFSLFESANPGSLFYFIGDGEDLSKIQEYVKEKELANSVILVGKKAPAEVAAYLNAADLYIMGSYIEGWSTSLIEAIACGIPACVTNFSSAREIVLEGINGTVVEGHNVELFVKGMFDAISLSRPVYNVNVQAFAANRLKDDLLNKWQLI
jgi:glycosyltransferase involved in cell wall biosynthesis